MLRLTYAISVREDSFDELGNDLSFSFGGGNATQTQDSQLRGRFRRDIVRLTRVDRSQAIVEVTIESEHLPLRTGGAPFLMSLLFGNPFRHKDISAARLINLALHNIGDRHFCGPANGLPAFENFFHTEAFPIISIPLNKELLSEQDRLTILLKAGVQCFIESPLVLQNTLELKKCLSLLEQSASLLGIKAAYFVNATADISLFLAYADIIERYKHNRYLFVGMRFCPLSLGLALVGAARAHEIPICGYNLMFRVVTGGSGFTISSAALTTLLRLVGCDIVNVGLTTREPDHIATATEVVDSALDEKTLACKPVVPLFTGGITPRVAFELVQRFGEKTILHTGRPIFKARSDVQVYRNIRALREAAECAHKYPTFDECLRYERNDSKNWRTYERDFGNE
jgi:ribulose 1,5-bisphosphate carboxylase large subunit-like protein